MLLLDWELLTVLSLFAWVWLDLDKLNFGFESPGVDVELARSFLELVVLDRLGRVVDELASHSIGAVSGLGVVVARFGLVKDGDLGFDHDVLAGMSE